MLKKIKFFFEPANEFRNIFIYLPLNYDEDLKRKYPVIYMFDGQNLFSDEDAYKGDSWHLLEYLDSNKKNIIIVGMENGAKNTIRAQEYIPYNCINRHNEIINSKTQKVFEWIINKLKPYINNNYRTQASPECTAIGGASYGGIAALYGAIKYRDHFSMCGALSPTVNIIIDKLLSDIERIEDFKNLQFFFSYGDNEVDMEWSKQYILNIKAITNMLTRKGCKIIFNFIKGGKHDSINWRKIAPKMIEFFFKK